MLSMLPIFVFGTLLMMWSRVALTSSPKAPESTEKTPTKLTIEFVTPDGKSNSES
jgi:hypothetical protein